MVVDVLELYLRGLVAGFALLLTVVAGIAYRRSPNRRLLFIAAALAMFTVSGGLLVYAGLEPAFPMGQLLLGITVLHVAILVMIYLSMIQRVRPHR